MAKYIDAEEITPIMAEYVADVFSRKEHLDDISYGYCMEIADVFRRYAERAKQEQQEVDLEKEKAARLYAIPHYMKDIDVNHIEEYPYDTGLEAAFIAGYKYHADHTPLPEDTVLFNKGVAEGKRLMMEDAVEGRVISNDGISFPVSNEIHRLELMEGDKVRIIIVKEG